MQSVCRDDGMATRTTVVTWSEDPESALFALVPSEVCDITVWREPGRRVETGGPPATAGKNGANWTHLPAVGIPAGLGGRVEEGQAANGFRSTPYSVPV
jgi:hypothetical protein